MNFKGIEICCPQCRGDLTQPHAGALACAACNRRYPVILDIPDLRLQPDPYIGFDEERAKVEKLTARFHEFDFEGFVDFYYSITSVVPPKHAQQYKRSLMAGVPRAAGWLEQWEQQAGTQPTRATLLEVGCGTGPLLVAAKNYASRVGVDIALRWLVVAKKRLEQEKIDLPLICASAEALPFRESVFDRGILDSAIEHIGNQQVGLREAHRVMKPGAAIFLATPNRRSIGPDPQTGIPCGSFLPAAWTDALVRRSGGIPPKRHLIVKGELRNLLRDAGFDDLRFALPGISAAQSAHFAAAMSLAIRGYEFARRLPLSKQLLFAIGPLLLATARKHH